jgi:hypothetical protein
MSLTKTHAIQTQNSLTQVNSPLVKEQDIKITEVNNKKIIRIDLKDNTSFIRFYSHSENTVKITSVCQKKLKPSKFIVKDTIHNNTVAFSLSSNEKNTIFNVYIPEGKDVFLNGKIITVECQNESTRVEDNKSLHIEAQKVHMNVNQNITFEKLNIRSEEVILTGNGKISVKKLEIDSAKIHSNLNITADQVKNTSDIRGKQITQSDKSSKTLTHQAQKPTRVLLEKKKIKKVPHISQNTKKNKKNSHKK